MPNDDSVVQIINRLGVDISPAIKSLRELEGAFVSINQLAERTKQQLKTLASGTGTTGTLSAETAKAAVAEERRLAAAQAMLPNLQAQLAATQSRISLERLSDGNLKTRAAYLRQQVDLLLEAAKAQGTLTKEQAAQVELLQAQVRELRAQASTIAADQRRSLGSTMSSMMVRRFEWFLAGGVFFGAQQALRSLSQEIGDVEERMISLARVIEDPAFDVAKMRTELFRLGEEYGQSFQNVHDIALRWAQAGYNMAETLELTEASLLALNTAELDAENATQSLIGIMAQWGFQANQLIPVIDKLNKVADDYAITTQDLVDALLRSSGAARNANMTFEQTVAMITAMREASGRTGREVGNALNSIISYTQRDVFLKALEKAGIPAFADASKGKLRPTFDIIADLAKNWDKLQEDVQRSFIEQADNAGLFSEEMAEAVGMLEEWTDLQRRDILQAGAGIYRRNYLLALLKNFSQVYEVLQTQEEALGYSQRENQRTMEGYTKQVQSLKTEIQELAYAIGEEGGLLTILKDLVSGTRNLVDAFNELPSATKSNIIHLIEFASVLGLISGTLRLFTGVGLIGGLKQLISALKNLVAGAGGFGILLRGSSRTLGVIGLVATAIGLIAKKISDVNREANRLQILFEETKKQTDETIKSLEAEAETHLQNASLVKDLAAEYRKLAEMRAEARKRGEEDADIAVQQEAITQRIREALGDEVAARLEAAQYAKVAADSVAEAERNKAREISQQVQEQILAYRQSVVAQMQETIRSIETIEKHQAGWMSYLGVWDRVKVAFYNMMQSIRLAWNATRQWFTQEIASFERWLASTLDRYPDFLPGAGKVSAWAASLREMAAENERKIAEYYIPNEALIRQEWEEAIKPITDARIAAQRKLLVELQNELNGLLGDTTPGVTTGYEYEPEFGTKEQDEAAKRLRDIARDLADAYTAQTEALQRLGEQYQRQESFLRNRIDYYTREGASLEELAQADTDRAKLLLILNSQQQNLHDTAEAAREAIRNLQAALERLDTSTEEGAEAYASLSSAIVEQQRVAEEASAEWWTLEREKAEIQRENNAISRYTIEMLEELQEKYQDGVLTLDEYRLALENLAVQEGLSAEASERLAEAQEKLVETELDERLDALKDAFSNGLITIEQYATGLKELSETMNLTGKAAQTLQQEQAKALREFYSTALKKEAERIEEEYEAATERIEEKLERSLERVDRQLERALDQIERRLQREIEPLQAELDSLTKEQTTIDREAARREHEQTLAELEEQRAYHALRLGREHEQALRDLERQIAEENRRWEEQQQRWLIEDRKEYLEERIRQAQEAAEEERKRVEEEAKEQREALREQAERQRRDLKKHYEEVTRITEEGILETLAALAATEPRWYETGRSLINQLIAGLESGDFGGILEEIDRIRRAAHGAVSAATGLTFGQSYGLAGYATGAWRIPHTQVAVLHPDESVLPDYAARAFRNFAQSTGRLDQVIEAAVNRIIQAIQSRPAGEMTVYGAQNAYIDDSVDLDAFTRSIVKQAVRLGAVRG